MRVACIFLDYGVRKAHTSRAAASLQRAGYHYDLTIIDMKGIAAAINKGLHDNPGYDAYAICANDIVMPEGWLARMVHYAETIPNTGIVGIHCVETLPPTDPATGVHLTWCPFGNWLITKELFDKIGYFNTAHDPYGMQDSDYGYRATKAGFVNYYIPNLKAEHIGHDVGNRDEYRMMKDEGLSKAGQTYSEWVQRYDNGFLYLDYDNGKA